MRPISDDAKSDSALPLWRILLAIGGVYTAQSIVGALTFQGVPSVLRADGVTLDVIGLVSVAMAPWALKFLWAPHIERYRLPGRRRRRSRRIVILGEGVVAAALILLAVVGPHERAALFATLGLIALASATVDIACDAFAIEQLPSRSRGWGNTAQVGGGYLGIVFGSGLFLVLVSAVGWFLAAIAMAGLIVLLTVPFALAHESDQPVTDVVSHRPTLRFALARLEIRYGLLLTVLFEVGVRLTQGMTSPFLVDAGIDLAMLGVLNGIGGTTAGLAGTFAGGFLVRLCGSSRAVMLAALFQTVVLGALACAVLLGVKAHFALISIVVLQSVSMAMGFVAVYSLLMGLASLLQAGVDFTLFQCADAAIAGVAGFGGGIVAQYFGYGSCFTAAASVSAGGVVIISLLLRKLSGTTQGQRS